MSSVEPNMLLVALLYLSPESSPNYDKDFKGAAGVGFDMGNFWLGTEIAGYQQNGSSPR